MGGVVRASVLASSSRLLALRTSSQASPKAEAKLESDASTKLDKGLLPSMADPVSRDAARPERLDPEASAKLGRALPSVRSCVGPPSDGMLSGREMSRREEMLGGDSDGSALEPALGSIVCAASSSTLALSSC
uniref:Uncharacterized protein n=1 Tax=Ixodes ricinus TaxID=34613 RepID=A0A6B0URH7_IXORI